MSKIHTFDLEEECYEEIKYILAKNGRPDLIQLLNAGRDNDYKPTKKEKLMAKTDNDCSSGEEESYEVSVDSNGFWSLK